MDFDIQNIEEQDDFKNEKLKNIFNAIEEDNEIIAKIDDTEYNLTYSRRNFESDKEYKAFINHVKRLIRSSLEYKEWVEFVRYTLDNNKCILTDESIEDVKIDIHHHPISLEVIVRTLLNYYIDNSIPFSTYTVASKVIELHYKLQVGFVALIRSLHEKFHNKKATNPLKISIHDVSGNWVKFLKIYGKYMDEEDMITVMNYISIKESDGYFKHMTQEDYLAFEEFKKNLLIENKNKGVE